MHASVPYQLLCPFLMCKLAGTTLQAYRQNAKLAATYSSGKTLLHEMLACRKKVQKLMKEYKCMLEPCVGPDRRSVPYYNELEYPTDAVLSQLEREGVLTRAKVHILRHEADQGQIVVRCWFHSLCMT